MQFVEAAVRSPKDDGRDGQDGLKEEEKEEEEEEEEEEQVDQSEWAEQVAQAKPLSSSSSSSSSSSGVAARRSQGRTPAPAPGRPGTTAAPTARKRAPAEGGQRRLASHVSGAQPSSGRRLNPRPAASAAAAH